MKPLIIALDVDTEKEALALVRETGPYADLFKVGPPLLLRYGPSIIKKLHRARKKVFLDLKFHDIPNTMMRSLKEATDLGVYSVSIHIQAGEKALNILSELPRRPYLWGVTVLTSLGPDDLKTFGCAHSPLNQALNLAAMGKRCRLNGIIASVGETAQIKAIVGPQMNLITPGIRLPENEPGDQKRIATPQHARHAGASFIVVGRPILESKKPAQATRAILNDWNRSAIKSR